MPTYDEYGNVFDDEGDAEIVDPHGNVFLSTNPTDIGAFGGAVRSYVDLRLWNGTFDMGPPTPSGQITPDNPLPFWTIDDNSDTLDITASWLSGGADDRGRTYPYRGASVQIAVAAGDDTTVTMTLAQNIALPRQLDRFRGYRGIVRLSPSNVGNDANVSLGLVVTPFGSDGVPISSSARSTVKTFAALNAESLPSIVVDFGNATGYGLEVELDVYRTGATAAVSVYVLNVELEPYSLLTTPHGYAPFALSLGSHHGSIVQTEANLAAVSGGLGGAWATAMHVPGPMLLSSFTLANRNTSALREAEWGLYADTGSNTLDQVPDATGTFSFTPVANSVRTSSLSTPVLIAPGLYWVVLRNTSTAQTFSIGFMNAGVLTTNTSRDNTAEAALSSTIDISAWTANTPLPLFRLGGRIGAEAADF